MKPPACTACADLITFWADQVAGLPESARGAMLAALASTHGVAFAERVRELLLTEGVAA